VLGLVFPGLYDGAGVKPPLKRLALIFGTGFWAGYLKPAPGMWGSLVGFGYFALLLHAPVMSRVPSLRA
jgi:hypothetical protein